MHLVTLPSHQGKGGAGLLIKWGIEQAEKDQIPAYLEAGVMGRPIYERYGFVQIGDLLKVGLKEFGVDMSFTMCKMGYFPREIDGEGAEVGRD
jgi:GNAT superfamily N-acetyltransferase